jgi:endonuclease YncB( thermonuclease family)
MRFLTKFTFAMVLPLFAPPEPWPLLASVVHAQAAASGWHPCVNPWVIDGDSIRCSNLGEIRLLGIDTPDFTFSAPCRGHYGNHVCDNAGDRAATRKLIALKLRMRSVEWTVLPVTRDHYGRLVAEVRAGSVDLSCYQLANGAARYIPEYDNGGRIARASVAMTD